jgi:hypothetical protein
MACGSILRFRRAKARPTKKFAFHVHARKANAPLIHQQRCSHSTLETRRAVRRTRTVFSMRQDASSKNPGHAANCGFGLDLNVFFGDFLDSRLRRSPSGPASPFARHAAQCAKESYPRESVEALLLIVDGHRHAHLLTAAPPTLPIRPQKAALMK